jgi:hypothetical protein
MKKAILRVLLIIIVFPFFSCAPKCFLVPRCIFVSTSTTNLKKNKYYEKKYFKSDSLLSTNFIYGIIENTDEYKNSENYKYIKFKETWYLFYNNGLVLEETHYRKDNKKDTIHTYTEDLKFACCHSWSVGCYKINNDTLSFGVMAGYQKEWSYYKAKIFEDRIRFFEKAEGEKKEIINLIFPKVVDRVVIRDIKLK